MIDPCLQDVAMSSQSEAPEGAGGGGDRPLAKLQQKGLAPDGSLEISPDDPLLQEFQNLDAWKGPVNKTTGHT